MHAGSVAKALFYVIKHKVYCSTFGFFLYHHEAMFILLVYVWTAFRQDYNYRALFWFSTYNKISNNKNSKKE